MASSEAQKYANKKYAQNHAIEKFGQLCEDLSCNQDDFLRASLLVFAE